MKMFLMQDILTLQHAINAIRFKMSSGNIDGTIYLYGIK
jgi:hypothetical protein